MAKKKKNIDIIKVKGLSSETIEEFAPKDNSEKEDKLWEEYFRGSPNILKFQKKVQSPSLPSTETEKEETTIVATATDVTIATIATTVDKSATVGKGVKQEKEYTTLDSTHTKSEQIVYSIMYRETITKGKSQEYFSIRKLMKSTGIGSDKTVYKALQGLIAKLSIWMVEHSNNKPQGTLYRVHIPRDIFKLREEARIIVDINTKRIVNTAVTTATAVAKATTPTKVKKKPKKRLNKSKKKEIGRIYNFIYQTRVGEERETTMVKDVESQCKREGISFDEDIYNKIVKESRRGRWEPGK